MHRCSEGKWRGEEKRREDWGGEKKRREKRRKERRREEQRREKKRKEEKRGEERLDKIIQTQTERSKRKDNNHNKDELL